MYWINSSICGSNARGRPAKGLQHPRGSILQNATWLCSTNDWSLFYANVGELNSSTCGSNSGGCPATCYTASSITECNMVVQGRWLILISWNIGCRAHTENCLELRQPWNAFIHLWTIKVCQLQMNHITFDKIKGRTLLKILPGFCTTDIPGNFFLNFGGEYWFAYLALPKLLRWGTRGKSWEDTIGFLG